MKQYLDFLRIMNLDSFTSHRYGQKYTASFPCARKNKNSRHHPPPSNAAPTDPPAHPGSRETVVDFTAPYYLEATTMVSPAPALTSRVFAIFSPFTYQVSGTWVVVRICLCYFSPKCIDCLCTHEKNCFDLT